jgi:Flp pilus assembly protein TadG
VGAVPDEHVQGWVVAGRRTLARRSSRGAAAVEFALVAIPLLIIVFGVITYGYMLSFRQSVSQAAAEGARAAAVAAPGADREQLARGAIQAAVGSSCSGSYLTCAITIDDDDGGCSCVQVELTYRYAQDPSKPKLLAFDLVAPDVLSYTASARIDP